MGDHKDNATIIDDMMRVIGDKYFEAVTGTYLDTNDNKQINNDVMNHSLFLRPHLRTRSKFSRLCNVR